MPATSPACAHANVAQSWSWVRRRRRSKATTGPSRSCDFAAPPGADRRSRLPATQIVDMRQELGEGNRSMFSRALQPGPAAGVHGGHQAIIFINRRGYAGFILCRQCGYVVKCRSCSVSLTSHLNGTRSGRRRQAEPVPADLPLLRQDHPSAATCPVCGSSRIGRFGAGTQQVEELFNQEFAPASAAHGPGHDGRPDLPCPAAGPVRQGSGRCADRYPDDRQRP